MAAGSISPLRASADTAGRALRDADRIQEKHLYFSLLLPFLLLPTSEYFLRCGADHFVTKCPSRGPSWVLRGGCCALRFFAAVQRSRCCFHQVHAEGESPCASLPARASRVPLPGSPSQARVAFQQSPCWGLNHNWGMWVRVCARVHLSPRVEGLLEGAFAGSLIRSILGRVPVPISAVPLLAGCVAWRSYLTGFGYSPPKKGRAAQSPYPKILTPCLT